MNSPHPEKAFTLAEVLITAAIFSLVCGAIMTTMIAGLSSWRVSEAKIQIQQDSRRAMQAMSQELRFSSSSGHLQILDDSGSAISTGTGSVIRFQVPLYTSQQIKLDSAGSKIWGGDSMENYWICYKVVKASEEDTGQLKRILLDSNKNEVSSGSMVLANNIESVEFIGLPNNTYSPTSVQIALTAANTKNVTTSLKSRVWLRNLN